MINKYLDLASEAYYSGNPILDDTVFDRLADIFNYNSIGAKQHENISKHYYPMYSLQKYYNEDSKENPLAHIKDTVVSPKLDGAAISILYIDGRLIQVLTRGDGDQGTDITSKFRSRKTLVPLEIPYLEVLQITGEIVSPKSINNSRNYAAGSLNLKSTDDFNSRNINFYAYGIYPFINETFVKDMDSIKDMGISTILEMGLSDVYHCDGLVYRVNSNSVFESMGYTSKHPRGAYAKKERQEAVETEILSVEWSVGKSGKITPIAILKPIYIGDKLISRATLNNPGFIDSLGISIGDKVGVILGGEIIPCITHKVGG